MNSSNGGIARRDNVTLRERETPMSMRTSLAALAIAGLSLAGGATAAAGVLAAAAPPAAAVLTATVAPPAVLTTFGNPHQPAAVTLADITGDGSQSQGIPIPH